MAFKMYRPALRPETQEHYKLTDRKAAVAIIRTRDTDPEYLLLKRADDPLDPWSGHYAFPGGGKEISDRSLLETSIRETFEECGILLDQRNLVARMPVKTAGAYLGKPIAVSPFVFELSQKPAITLQDSEVAGYEWIQSSRLRDPRYRTQRCMSEEFPLQAFPCIRARDGLIWGFTYELLCKILFS